MSLKEKAVNGFLWNSVGSFSSLAIEFIVGIVLARLLSPYEFGLIGMITVIITISDIFINSGFSQALIRKNDCTQADYSTAFLFNLIVGGGFFGLLFLLAPWIAWFYEEPPLKSLVQVLALSLIISSLTIIQRTDLIKKIDFKLQTKINVISSVSSGVLAVFLAIYGFGVWSLVVKTLSREGVKSGLYWVWNGWKPSIEFSRESFRYLFGFGSKLLLSGLLGRVFDNIYYVIIGKYFSAQQLGFFTRAQLFNNLPSKNIGSVLTAVGYPLLAKVQDDPVQFKAIFKRLLKSAAFIVFMAMAGTAAVAEPLILTLIGEKWSQSIPYLQMLCLAGMMYPLCTINVNLLNIVGRSDLYLKNQFIIQLMTIPVAIFGVFFGIEALIGGIVFNSILSFVIFGYSAQRFSNYSLLEQVRGLTPSFLLAIFMGGAVYALGEILPFPHYLILICQMIFGMLLAFIISEWTKLEEYQYIKETLLEKLDRRRNAKEETGKASSEEDEEIELH